MKRLLVISDLHIGSAFGLMLPDFVNADGQAICLNAGQKYLWECWTHMLDNVPRPVSAVIVNGDVVDGRNPKQRGAELTLVSREDQIAVAREVLKDAKKKLGNPTFYFVQGTAYHDHDTNEPIAEGIGVQYYGLGSGRHSREVLDLSVDGVIVNFAHHGPGVAGLYRATGADKEGIFSALAGKEGKSLKADCLVRGHNHFFIHVEHENKHIVYSPCWQLQTRFMRHKSVYQMLPSIGVTWIEIDADAKNDGNDPITVRKKIYKLPALKPVELK